MVMLMSMFVIGCRSDQQFVKPISDTFEAQYTPNYNAPIDNALVQPSGFSVCIIKDKELWSKGNAFVVSNKALDVLTLTKDFKSVMESSLEKLFLSKGVKVSGYYESIKEMTYPERDRCTYLVEPKLTFAMSIILNHQKPLEEYTSSDIKYYQESNTLIGNIVMEYVILDPLTGERLERHTFDTSQIRYEFNSIRRQYSSSVDMFPVIGRDYYNEVNPFAKAYESAYKELYFKLDRLSMLDEFNHLLKYKETLKTKKVY
jgi:hypothetical protein